MVKVKVRLAYYPLSREVYAVGYEVAQGIVAHRQIETPSNWQLTQNSTGMRLSSWDYYTLREAEAAARRVSALFDFNKAEARFGSNSLLDATPMEKAKLKRLLSPYNSVEG